MATQIADPCEIDYQDEAIEATMTLRDFPTSKLSSSRAAINSYKRVLPRSTI